MSLKHGQDSPVSSIEWRERPDPHAELIAWCEREYERVILGKAVATRPAMARTAAKSSHPSGQKAAVHGGPIWVTAGARGEFLSALFNGINAVRRDTRAIPTALVISASELARIVAGDEYKNLVLYTIKTRDEDPEPDPAWVLSQLSGIGRIFVEKMPPEPDEPNDRGERSCGFCARCLWGNWPEKKPVAPEAADWRRRWPATRRGGVCPECGWIWSLDFTPDVRWHSPCCSLSRLARPDSLDVETIVKLLGRVEKILAALVRIEKEKSGGMPSSENLGAERSDLP